MGPDKPKGEVPPRETAEREERSVRKDVAREGKGRAAPQEIDEREEEGFSQPESSAQKGPSSPEPEEP